MNHVLIVDDEAEIRDSLESILREEGYTGHHQRDRNRSAWCCCATPPMMWSCSTSGCPIATASTRLQEIRQLDGGNAAGGHHHQRPRHHRGAVRATKLGALRLSREAALARPHAHRAEECHGGAPAARGQRRVLAPAPPRARYLTGESVPIKALRQQIKLMAPTNGRVLIFGESGTGKELIGRAMHAESLRRDRRLRRAELRRHPRGLISRSSSSAIATAPFPADRRRNAAPWNAPIGGTLFLDEVGDMSLKTQAKVLRALDEQRFLPVGASQPVHVDVRVIAATNKDLEEEIARGNFREDLFYRLNVIPFFVPPLRDRKEDIPLLVRSFSGVWPAVRPPPRRNHRRRARPCSKQYHWPGNVRELRNLVERVVILNPQVTRIERKHLPMLVAPRPRQAC